MDTIIRDCILHDNPYTLDLYIGDRIYLITEVSNVFIAGKYVLDDKVKIVEYILNKGVTVDMLIDNIIELRKGKRYETPRSYMNASNDMLLLLKDRGLRFDTNRSKMFLCMFLHKPDQLELLLKDTDNVNMVRFFYKYISLLYSPEFYIMDDDGDDNDDEYILHKSDIVFDNDMLQGLDILIKYTNVDVSSIIKWTDLNVIKVFIDNGLQITMDLIHKIITNITNIDKSRDLLLYLLNGVGFEKTSRYNKQLIPELIRSFNIETSLYTLYSLITILLEFGIKIEKTYKSVRKTFNTYDLLMNIPKRTFYENTEENSKLFTTIVDIVEENMNDQYNRYDLLPTYKLIQLKQYDIIRFKPFIPIEIIFKLLDMKIPSDLRENLMNRLISKEKYNVIRESSLFENVPDDIIENILLF